MENTKCPKCGSKNLKKDGPFAKRKEEGANAHKGVDVIKIIVGIVSRNGKRVSKDKLFKKIGLEAYFVYI